MVVGKVQEGRKYEGAKEEKRNRVRKTKTKK